ncbi:hypothetical protein K501DRAFT_238121 [Backusella circina FSU 941]|nr:hypothetical protein K501DRAFT_238121 [Backusella circina FSU 941]
MKVKIDKKTTVPITCPYKRQLESTHPYKFTKPYAFTFSQACSILHAIELNQRKRLSKRCLANLAFYVAQAWESNPTQEKVQQLYYMMSNLLDTTSIDKNIPLDEALKKFVSNPAPTPTVCSTLTLLIAISYVERLNKQYKNLKGTAGCGSRMIMIAYIMASKYIHQCLSLIIYANDRVSTKVEKVEAPITPPTSPHQHKCSIPFLISPTNTTTATPKKAEDDEKNQRIAKMEQEFLYFLHYDLSIQDPSLFIKWAQSYEEQKQEEQVEKNTEEQYTSADEGDDEMDDDNE